MIIDRLSGGGLLFWTEDYPVWLFQEGEDPEEFFAWLESETGCCRDDTPLRAHSWRMGMICIWRGEKQLTV